MDRLKQILSVISSQSDIKISKAFVHNDSVTEFIEGSITLSIGPSVILEFEVLITPFYPFQHQGHESILFKNKSLVRFGHVMSNGTICIHTSHSANLKEKLTYDLNSLRLWIEKYYKNASSVKYEHISISPTLFENQYYSICYNNVEKTFIKGETGLINFSEGHLGIYNEKPISNLYLQSFTSIDSKLLCELNWNPKIKSLKSHLGIYVYIEDIPAKYGKFSFTKWSELKPFLSEGFLHILHRWRHKNSMIPIILGYKIPSGELHWELIILKQDDLPVKKQKNAQRKWINIIDEQKEIVWGKTYNVSYDYFFGRGKMNKKITSSKILIIGLGAIGSMIANILTRGGCKNISLVDYDVKIPENICRSEYNLNPLVCTKTEDLKNLMYSISPYVEIPSFDLEFKLLFENNNAELKKVEEIINSYDFIFDCTTDNDLLYTLSKLNLEKKFFSFSITNKAEHMVCACDGDRYKFSQIQFKNVLDSDTDDLYEPTGCWNPTFKASYNDIGVLVHTAMKQINLKLEKNQPLNNFVVGTSFVNNFQIEINEF
nr:ThiF family adenylyltransferase [uncultured Chryseobacterium sp.]